MDNGDTSDRDDQLIADLTALTAREPLDEGAHARLIAALAAAGQQADALGVYHDLAERLDTEFGAAPGPELTAAYLQALGEAPAAAPAGPGGGQRAGQDGPAVPRQLPVAIPRFVGRLAELKALSGLLDQAADGGGTVVITAIGGTAGVGKTTLAVHWAHQVTGRFPDGQLYVNLRGFGPSAGPVPATEAIRLFLDGLGVAPDQVPAGLAEQATLYRSLLSGKQVLIVADNASDPGQVRPLLPDTPGCLVLVTSRNQLTGLAGHANTHLLSLDVLSETEACELLAARVGRARAAREPAAVTELARLCAGLPLALSVAAARAAARPLLPLAALAAELGSAAGRLDALGTPDAAADVRTVFSWSYRQLSAPAARMFRLLAVHPGPDIGLPAAASLAGLPPGEARRALAELTGSHLISEHIPGRFALHDLLRAYGAELAGSQDSATERDEAVRRVQDYYVHSAHAAALHLHHGREQLGLTAPAPGVTPDAPVGEAEAMAWFEVEHAVLVACVSQAGAAGLDGYAWRLPATMADFLKRRGYWHDWAATQREALAAADRAADPAWQARAHRSLGTVDTYLGLDDDALDQLSQALDLYAQLGDDGGQARVHQMLCMLYERQGRYRLSLEHASRCLDLARASGEPGEQAIALNTVGWYHAVLGEHEQALTFCRAALELLGPLGDLGNEGATWHSIGYVLGRQGQHAEAADAYRRADTLFHRNSDRYYQATALIGLGDELAAMANRAGARAAWREARVILDDLGHPEAEQVRARLGGAWQPADADGLAGVDTVVPMNDKEILAHIDGLIQTEHELRTKLAAGEISNQEEHEQLASAEQALDQCWDLLRQRRARREFGQDPADAQARPVSEVEGYRQ